MGLHFFRVPYLLHGPWYLTWLTSFVGLRWSSSTASGTGWSSGGGTSPGCWCSSPPRYWPGWLPSWVTLTDNWNAVWQVLRTTLTAPLLLAVLAAAAALLGLGGFTTLRRVRPGHLFRPGFVPSSSDRARSTANSPRRRSPKPVAACPGQIRRR